MRKIVLSKRAQLKLTKLLDYLETHWSPKVKFQFIVKLDERLTIIKESPELFPKSNMKADLYKSVLNKQTTIFYTFDSQSIRINSNFR